VAQLLVRWHIARWRMTSRTAFVCGVTCYSSNRDACRAGPVGFTAEMVGTNNRNQRSFRSDLLHARDSSEPRSIRRTREWMHCLLLRTTGTPNTRLTCSPPDAAAIGFPSRCLDPRRRLITSEAGSASIRPRPQASTYMLAARTRKDGMACRWPDRRTDM
jgi:hypothetical protein